MWKDRISEVVILILLTVVTNSINGQPLSTRSFTNGDLGSDPNAVVLNNQTIEIDLSAISSANVHRATLDLYARPERYFDIHGDGNYPLSDATLNPYILIAPGGDTLELLPPRYLVFDATEAVQNALDQGVLEIEIANSGQGIGETVSLDILSDASVISEVTQVSNASAYHQDGSTMITFTEVNPYHLESTWTRSEFLEAIDNVFMHDRSPKIRYRIYRSASPIETSEDLLEAELIDEIMPLSVWNYTSNSGSDVIYPYPIGELQEADPETGIYVHQHQGQDDATAYYYISHTVNGVEDFSNLSTGGNVTEAVNESSGNGLTLEWRRDTITDGWYFWADKNPILHHYVKWESPPYWNLPSKGFNYFVAEPHEDWSVNQPSLEVGPHAWGGSYAGAHPWWSYYDGGILLSQNLIYYNSYTAFHEHACTLKPWSEGTVQPFFQARAGRFIEDFLIEAFNIDTNRIFLSGASMGGAAGHLWGMRSTDFFSHILAEVGNNIPAEDPCCVWEFANWGAYGLPEWELPFSNLQMERFGHEVVTPEMDYSVWDYYDNTQWLVENLTAETPFIAFTNSTDDPAIGWEQAFETANVVRTTKRPHAFFWGANGHNWPLGWVDIPTRSNESLPAFTNCSLDDELGSIPSEAVEGQRNQFLRWNVLTDTDDQWEIEVFLDASAPSSSCTVDLTPRRLQNFLTASGSCYSWELTSETTVVDQGLVTADEFGLLTLEGLSVDLNSRTLSIQPCALNTVDPVELDVSLFPNPAIDQLRIKMARGSMESYAIFNPLGIQVASGDNLDRASVSIDLSHLSSGIYSCFIETSEGSISRTFVVR